MISSGLVSITFRQLTVDQIIKLVEKAQFCAIEWGGDIHVPHGDLKRAHETRQKTIDAGLAVSSYGSYYRVGHNEPVPYESVLETAVALGAPIVRVWAGKRNAEDADRQYWQRVVEDSRKIANLSASTGLKVAYEYHGNTLTNTLGSTLKLLKDVGHEEFTSYWQTSASVTVEDQLNALDLLHPWLSNIHVNTGRQPLKNNEAWKLYLRKVTLTGRNHYALIEFVKDDSPEHFFEDANTLKTWLQTIQ